MTMFKRNLIPVIRNFKRNCNFVCNPCVPVIAPCFWSYAPNGMKVICETTCSPLTCLSLTVEVGPRYEVACNHGITHFIEHLAYKGFCSLPRLQFECSVRSMGGRMSVKTYRDRQVFTIICPSSQDLKPFMNFLARIFVELEPSERDVACAKIAIEQELIDSDNNPKQITFDLLHQAAFQGTPLAKRVMGPACNYERFDKSFAKVYISENYIPNKFTLAVSGAYTYDDVYCMVQEQFGFMQARCCDLDVDRARFTASEAIYRDDSLPLLHAALAVEVPGYYSPDYWNLNILKFLIGRWEKGQGGGYNAWPSLAQAVAMGGFCHRYEPFYIAYKDVGLWGIYFVCRTLKAEDMLYNIQDNLMSICNTVSLSNAKRATETFKLHLAKSMEGAIRSCKDIGEQMFYKGLRKNLNDLDSHLIVNNEELSKVADKYIYDRDPVVAAVGPSEGLPNYNRIASGMYWLRM